MTPIEMHTSDLANHLLQRLYELAEASDYSTTHSLDDLATEVGIRDSGKVHNVAKLLEGRGLIHAIYTLANTLGRITGEGALVMESSGTSQPAPNRRLPAPELRAVSKGLEEIVESWEGLLHPAIRASALKQYQDGHWRDAVLNACIAVFERIKERTGVDLDGDTLVTHAFSVRNPILAVTELDTESGRNDQTGFMTILQGVYRGIRNPKAHSLRSDLDALKAAQHLVMASLLARRVDEAELIKPADGRSESAKA